MTQTFRVALLTYSTRPRGGVVHTLELAEALTRAGAVVDVWSLARGGDAGFFRPVDPRVTLRLVGFTHQDDETVGERITRSIQVLHGGFASAPEVYDVVHAQDCISANAVPDCIRTIHHLDTFSTPELVACHERAITAPHGHICVSAAVADEVEAGWGFRPIVIANGVDAERYAAAAAATPAASLARLQWRRRLGDFVLSLGGIEPRKGTADLVEAMARVQAARPGLRLVIGGGETLFDYRDYRASVLARADELGVDLEILGPVDHDSLPALLAAARVFAFPSVKEGFGMAALEAVAAGVPVVMRSLPVLREVFHGAADFIETVPEMAEAILAAAAASTSPNRDARRRELVAAHTWDAAARGHIDYYQRNAPAADARRLRCPDVSTAC